MRENSESLLIDSAFTATQPDSMLAKSQADGWLCRDRRIIAAPASEIWSKALCCLRSKKHQLKQTAIPSRTTCRDYDQIAIQPFHSGGFASTPLRGMALPDSDCN